MNSFWQDIRYGMRVLRGSPGLTAVVIITLAVGIGANTAVFSIVNEFILKPVAARDPAQIVVVASHAQQFPLMFQSSYAAMKDFRNQVPAFSDVFADELEIGGLSVDAQADKFVFSGVSGNYFTALGVQPAAGRLFLPGEGEKAGDPPTVVLGYSYWQRRFGGDMSVIGKQAMLNGKPATIIGVTPKGFQGLAFAFDMQGYVTLNAAASIATGKASTDPNTFWADRGNRDLRILARLKPGVTVAQANSELKVVGERLAEQYAATDKGTDYRAVPERFARPQPYPTNIIVVIAGVFLALAGLVLLLACMNVANVLLARALARQREMAVRAALGASRARLIRQTLTETLLLSLFGGVAGLLLGVWISSLNSVHGFTSIPVSLDFSFDGRVFAYGLASAILTGMIAGAWPALRASRADVTTVLHEGGRGGSVGRGRQRIRSFLVVSQIAGSVLLLIAAGLFVRSLQKAQQMNFGFDPNHVVLVATDPFEIGYDQTRTTNFYRELEARARALPGAESMAMAYSVPMGIFQTGGHLYIEEHPLGPGVERPVLTYNRVDPNYFATMRTPILRGRAFTEADDEKSTPVAIINEEMARKFWPGEDAIGKRFSTVADAGPFIQVVGIVPTGKYIFVGESALPYFFLPLTQDYCSLRVLTIRTSGSTDQTLVAAQQLVHDLSPDLPVFSAQTMTQSLGGANGFFIFRRGAILGVLMGVLGMVLSVVGVYGVVSYAAAQRTREIGIRMALGAGNRDILEMVIRQGLGLVIAGVTIGLAAAWLMTRPMGRMLIGVGATDPVTYISVAVFLAGVALLACWIPARRAAAFDPLEALRYE